MMHSNNPHGGAILIEPLTVRISTAVQLRAALAERKIAACIPSKSNRKVPIPHDTALYRQRHKVENMFGRIKDWRRIHTRYDRCAHPSCPPSASPQPLYSGLINES